MSEGQERSPHVKLALRTIGEYVKNGCVIDPPDDLSAEMFSERAGVFVSLKKFGNLRGCIGTIEPTQDCIAREIIHNAISSATGDPRFSPVQPEELPHLVCSVDVLYPAEPVEDESQLDPKKYGVIVQCGRRRGLLLPNLEGVDKVEDQIAIACQKACIFPGEPYQLHRFEVKRYY